MKTFMIILYIEGYNIEQDYHSARGDETLDGLSPKHSHSLNFTISLHRYRSHKHCCKSDENLNICKSNSA